MDQTATEAPQRPAQNTEQNYGVAPVTRQPQQRAPAVAAAPAVPKMQAQAMPTDVFTQSANQAAAMREKEEQDRAAQAAAQRERDAERQRQAAQEAEQRMMEEERRREQERAMAAQREAAERAETERRRQEQLAEEERRIFEAKNEAEKRQQIRQLILEAEDQMAVVGRELSQTRDDAQKKQEQIDQQIENLENVSETLREEQNRVAKLKLQSELRDKELQIAQQNLQESGAKTKTLLEGQLFKFGRSGKTSPKQKYVWFHVLDNGVPVIDWSTSEKANVVNRLVVTKVFADETLIRGDFYKDRVFAVETMPLKKVLAFATEDHEECARWFHVIQKALIDQPDAKKTESKNIVFELTFDRRPLGFGVDVTDDENGSMLVVTSIQNRDLGLCEGVTLVSCNDVEFEGKTHNEMIDALTYVPLPLTIRFSGTAAQLRGMVDLDDEDRPGTRHNRSLSMAELYPAQALENPASHPLVKENQEFQKWLENPAFADLMETLNKDPQKLREFMKNADI